MYGFFSPQPMMPPYGAPYAAIYAHGGVYAHPGVPLVSVYLWLLVNLKTLKITC